MLGVPPTASGAVIKQAYRRLATALHPDQTPGRPALRGAVQDCGRSLRRAPRTPTRRAQYANTGFSKPPARPRPALYAAAEGAGWRPFGV
ncbi:MAG: DnaJ domain-containing protein [Hymenobacter sp.]